MVGGRETAVELRYILTLSASASLSVCKFSLHYQRKVSSLIMRINQMIIRCKLSQMKNQNSSNLLTRNGFKDSFGQISKMSECAS